MLVTLAGNEQAQIYQVSCKLLNLFTSLSSMGALSEGSCAMPVRSLVEQAPFPTLNHAGYTSELAIFLRESSSYAEVSCILGDVEGIVITDCSPASLLLMAYDDKQICGCERIPYYEQTIHHPEFMHYDGGNLHLVLADEWDQDKWLMDNQKGVDYYMCHAMELAPCYMIDRHSDYMDNEIARVVHSHLKDETCIYNPACGDKIFNGIYDLI